MCAKSSRPGLSTCTCTCTAVSQHATHVWSHLNVHQHGSHATCMQQLEQLVSSVTMHSLSAHASAGLTHPSTSLRRAVARVQLVSRQLCALPRVPGFDVAVQPTVASIQHPQQQGRQLRLQATSQLVPPSNASFRIHRITGDGSCMFRAIVQGVQVATRGQPMTVKSETTAALNLRASIVDELRNRRSEMEPFIAGITDDWDEYLQRMSHPAAWGGEPEMVMAVNVIKRAITVYRPTGGTVEPIVTYGEELLAAHPAINLLWSGAHYDLLVPAEPAQPPSAATAA